MTCLRSREALDRLVRATKRALPTHAMAMPADLDVTFARSFDGDAVAALAPGAAGRLQEQRALARALARQYKLKACLSKTNKLHKRSDGSTSCRWGQPTYFKWGVRKLPETNDAELSNKRVGLYKRVHDLWKHDCDEHRDCKKQDDNAKRGVRASC